MTVELGSSDTDLPLRWAAPKPAGDRVSRLVTDAMVRAPNPRGN
jgi:hypothetical protein